MNFIKKHLDILIFIVLEVCLYTSFLTLDFIDTTISNYIKYASIIICLLMSLYIAIRKKGEFCSVFTSFGLLFTVISDYFLLLNHDNNLFIIGVFTFFVGQVFYFIMLLKRRNFSHLYFDLGIRIILTLIIIFVSLGIKLDTLTTLALIYFVELFANFVSSLTLIKRDKKVVFLSLGLFLFILCDINVALNNLRIESSTLRFVVFYLMWLFYLPSQVIISINSYFLE